LLAMVGAGVGIAVVVGAARTIRLEHVEFIPLVEKDLILPVSLVWRTENHSPALHAVLRVAENALPTPIERDVD